MNKEEKSNKKSDDNLDFLNDYKLVAYWALALAIIGYCLAKTLFKFKIATAVDMALIGDYFGGLLSPTFALIGLFALLATIKLQSKALKVSSTELANSSNELALTRQEIEKSTRIQKEQSDSLKIQNDSIKQQNFENTFFNMINLHNEIINNMLLEKTNSSGSHRYILNPYTINGVSITLSNDKDYKGKKALSQLRKILKIYQSEQKGDDQNELYSNFYQEYSETLANYFNNIHQILKFIDDSKKKGTIVDTETYSDLIKAQFLQSEFELLFFHCSLSSNLNISQTRTYIEKFCFFDHLNPSQNMTKQMYEEFNKDAYGNKTTAFSIFFLALK